MLNDNRDEVLELDELEDGLFEAADRDADDALDDDEFLFDDWDFQETVLRGWRYDCRPQWEHVVWIALTALLAAIYVNKTGTPGVY